MSTSNRPTNQFESDSALLYPKARELFLTQQLHWLNDDYRVAFCTEGYSPDENDQTLAHIPATAIVSPNASVLTGKSAADGWAASDPILMESYLDTEARPITSAVIYWDTDPYWLVARLTYGFGIPFQALGFDYLIGYTGAGWFRL